MRKHKMMATVEEQYQLYLKLCELKEENFGEVQRTEMRRVFFGAYGMAFDVIIELLATKNRQQMNEEINKITIQVGSFWAKENLQTPEKPKDDGGFKIIH